MLSPFFQVNKELEGKLHELEGKLHDLENLERQNSILKNVSNINSNFDLERLYLNAIIHLTLCIL